MRTIFTLAFCLFSVSCEINHYKATAVAGNTVEEFNAQFGGTRSARRSDGSSYANDYQKTAQDFFTFAGVLVGGWFKVVDNANTATANAYADANGVIRDANGNVLAYMTSKVPEGGLAPGQTVPVLNQLAPGKLPIFKTH